MSIFRGPAAPLAAFSGAILAVTLGVGAISAGPTRGPIPEAAFPAEGGMINRDLIPDYIPALDRSGETVGWVSKELAVPVVDEGNRLLIPVLADDLRTVVGHMVAGHGYAPLGTDVASLLDHLTAPPTPASAEE